MRLLSGLESCREYCGASQTGAVLGTGQKT